MIMGRKNELLCSKCRKRVSYKIFKRPVKVKIKDMELEYEEYYGICDNCKSELFVPGVTDQNEERIEELYRKRKNLITISEIKKILNKYNIENLKSNIFFIFNLYKKYKHLSIPLNSGNSFY